MQALHAPGARANTLGLGRVEVPKEKAAADVRVDSGCEPSPPGTAYLPGPWMLSRPALSSGGRWEVPNLGAATEDFVLSICGPMLEGSW